MMDGAWSALLVDHMSGLLCKLAVLADSSSEAKQLRIQQQQQMNSEEEQHSENMHIEQA